LALWKIKIESNNNERVCGAFTPDAVPMPCHAAPLAVLLLQHRPTSKMPQRATPRGIGSGGGAEIAGVDSNGGNRMRWTMKEWISTS